MISSRDKRRLLYHVLFKMRENHRKVADKNSDEVVLNDVKALHAALALDIGLFKNATVYEAVWDELITLDPLTYLRLFDRMTEALLAYAREGFCSEAHDAFALTVNEILKGYEAFHSLIASNFDTSQLDFEVSFKSVYQFLCFPLRVNTSWAVPDLDTFVETNQSRCHRASNRLKALAKMTVDDEFWNDVILHFSPHHGPGAVCYTCPDSKQLRTARLNPAQKDELISTFTVLNWWHVSVNELPSSYFATRFPKDNPNPELPVKVVSVPKSWKKRRNIAVETATAMYTQQGLREGLYAALSNSQWWASHVSLEHPERNREYAKLGSMFGGFATVDLSAASDSVGMEFVRSVFADTPLASILHLFTGKEFDVEGNVVSSKIFATMGNAIAFPVETMVFALIAEEACQATNTRPEFQVYGDDIVVPARAVGALMILLERYGFNVNKAKTFINEKGVSFFRESCGGEYLNGVNVTPLRISRRFRGLPTDSRGVEEIQGVISFANEAYTYGFKTLYKLLVAYLFEQLGLRLPFSSDGGIGLINHNPIACMHAYPGRINRDLQRIEVCCSVAVHTTKVVERLDRLAYAEWLSRNHARTELSPSITRKGKGGRILDSRSVTLQVSSSYSFNFIEVEDLLETPSSDEFSNFKRLLE